MGNRIPNTNNQVGSNRILVDYAGNGDTDELQAALDAAAAYASAGSRWLVQVAPGLYTGQFTLQNYVDLAGLAPGGAAHLKSLSGALFANAATCTISNLRLETVDAPVLGLAAGFTGVMALAGVIVDQTALDVGPLDVQGGTLRVYHALLLSGGPAQIGGGTLELYDTILRNQALADGSSNSALYMSGGDLRLYRSVVENSGAAGYGLLVAGTGGTRKGFHTIFRKKDSTYAVHAAAANTAMTLAGCAGNAALHPNLTGYLNYVYDAAV